MAGHPRERPQARGLGAKDHVDDHVAEAGTEPVDHGAGHPADIAQPQGHEDPLNGVTASRQRGRAKGREAAAHRRKLGAEEQARVAVRQQGVIQGPPARAGIQDDVGAQGAVGQVVDDQAGAAAGQGLVVRPGEPIVVKDQGVESLAG